MACLDNSVDWSSEEFKFSVEFLPQSFFSKMSSENYSLRISCDAQPFFVFCGEKTRSWFRYNFYNRGKRVASTSTTRCTNYWKGWLRVAFDYDRPCNNYIYIYIRLVNGAFFSLWRDTVSVFHIPTFSRLGGQILSFQKHKAELNSQLFNLICKTTGMSVKKNQIVSLYNSAP